MPSFGCPLDQRRGRNFWLQRFAGNPHLMENLLDEARRGEMQLNTTLSICFWKRRTSCKNSSTLITVARAGCRQLRLYLPGLASMALEAKGETPSAVTRLSVVAKVNRKMSRVAVSRRDELSFRPEGRGSRPAGRRTGTSDNVTDVVKGADSLSAILPGDIAEMTSQRYSVL